MSLSKCSISVSRLHFAKSRVAFTTPMQRSISLLAAVSILGLGFTGCETTGQTTLLGAGTGAAIAAATDHSALHGAAIGAGAGFLLGKLVKYHRETAYGYRYDDRYARSPVARRSRPGFVISPYRPYYEIDVRGFPHGARVIDPSNEKVFINP
jgi:YMGG-like Gly-zipper